MDEEVCVRSSMVVQEWNSFIDLMSLFTSVIRVEFQGTESNIRSQGSVRILGLPGVFHALKRSAGKQVN